MAAVSAIQIANPTLSTTTVDTVTLSGRAETGVRIGNRSGTAYLFVTVGTTTPADPVAGAAENFCIPAGLWRDIPFGPITGMIVKVLGNGNDYTVELF